MIKLVASDVDGTLVQEGANQLHPEYYQVIRQLKEKGIQVVVASGRPYPSILNLFRPVEDLVWFVADGGATIKTTGDVTVTGEFPQDWAKELWQDMSQVPGAEGMICCLDQVYVPHKQGALYDLAKNHYKMNVVAQQGWQDIPPVTTAKISLFHQTNIQGYADSHIRPKWQGKINMVIAGEWWLDCMMPTVNKATALETIMQQHGYQASQLMASGDNFNDLEMITLAEVGLAVSSAREEVKAAANRVIGNFENHGVLEEWKKLLEL